jgi:hypothetical protein
MSRKGRTIEDLGRRKPRRSPYDRVLIVCEGGKTEPYYFRAMIDDLRLNTANVEVDGNSDTSPRSIIAYAKRRYHEDLKRNGRDNGFDRVYCVFDRDEHETYEEAVNAIQTASPTGVFFAAISNPCFEFWILLHFNPTTKPFARTGNRSPCDNAGHDLKSYIPNYQKGDKTIYQQIKHQMDIAIQRAKLVNDAARTSGFDNPSTSIPELIEYLSHLGK